MQGKENIFSIFVLILVQRFLLQTGDDTRVLLRDLKNSPSEKTGKQYIQWMGETKAKIENVMLKDKVVPRLLHTCFRHLEVTLV